MTNQTDIAIIGMSGVFPEAETLELFYKNLRDGRNSVRKIPTERILNACLDPEVAYMDLAYMDRIDEFDYKFFGFSKNDANKLDPQQRILLQLVVHAIENAGYSIRRFKGSKTCVSLGVGENGYNTRQREYGEFDPAFSVLNHVAMTAARIANFFDFRGSAIVIDTTCSSSLVAIDDCVSKLKTHKADLAIAGGILSLCDPLRAEDSGVGINSRDGFSKTFDESADGTGGGEGGGIVLLKRLDDAIRDGDIIHAVIKGSAVNQDGGRSNGITAPSPVAQTEVILEAWEQSGLNPETISYIEVHGTGTKLGDPIEFQGITEAFKKHSIKTKFCALSALKTNIGHLDRAAGIAGLIKAVLSIKNKELLPSLHFINPNPYINFNNSAAYVNTELCNWNPENGIRRAGVSAFGLSGTNAHLLLEEFPAKEFTQSNESAYLLTLSAKSLSALQHYIQNVHTFINETDCHLSNFCYTMNSGRSAYNFRTSISFESREELLEKLSTQTAVKETQNISETVFLLSNGTFTKAQLSALQETFPLFNQLYITTVQHLPMNIDSTSVRSFIDQYVLVKFLETLGVKPKVVIGLGVGKYLKNVLTGEDSFEKGVENAFGLKSDVDTIEERKLVSILNHLKNKQMLFVDLGLDDIFYNSLESIKSNNHEFQNLNLTKTIDGNIYQVIGELYQHGFEINWNALYQEKVVYRIEAPVYPFEKHRCWFRPPLESLAGPIENHMYQFSWVRQNISLLKPLPANKVFLVFTNAGATENQIIDELTKAGNTCIALEKADSFLEINPTKFQLNVLNFNQLSLVVETLKKRQTSIDGVLYLSDLKEKKTAREDLVNQTVGSHFLLSKVMRSFFSQKKFTYLYAYNASKAFPEYAMNQGYLKALISDFPQLVVKGIACLDCSEQDQVQNILNELNSSDIISFVSYKQGLRHVQLLEPIHPVPANKTYTFKNQGLYIITGGARGVGLEIATMIAKQQKVHLVLLGRRPSPDAEELDGITQIRLSGSSVTYHSVNLADKDAMGRVFEKIKSVHTRIDGVFHCAGTPIDSDPLFERTDETFQKMFDAKVSGTLILNDLLAGWGTEFFVLFSSLNSVIAQKNSADYAAANAFLDGFAHSGLVNAKVVRSINWPGWAETGMSVRGMVSKISDQSSPIKPLRTINGMKALHIALLYESPQIIVAEAEITHFKSNPFFLIENSQTTKTEVEENTKAIKETNESVAFTIKETDYSETEQRIATIWYDVLGFDEISLSDDYFEVGGHSLNGMQVINRIEGQFNLELEFEDLFEYPTIHQLAVHLDSLKGSEKNEVLYEHIPKLPEADYYDLSHAQKRLWAIDQYRTDHSAYNMLLVEEFHGVFDLKAFRDTYSSLIERHESLRTVFRTIDGEVKQFILSPQKIISELQEVDLVDHKEKGLMEHQTIEEMLFQPFDLSEGPLTKACIIKLDENVYKIVFTMHHIISDGWSVDVLLKEFTAYYNHYSTGFALNLKPLTLHYKDYAAWQNSRIRSGKMDKARLYWLNKLGGFSGELDLPTDFKRPKVQSFSGHLLGMFCNSTAIGSLRKVALENETTLFIVLLAIVKVLIYRYTKQTDVFIGTPVACREHLDLEDQIGFYTNTVVFRSPIHTERTITELLHSIHLDAMESFKFQDYPFDILVEDLKIPRDISRSPLSDVFINCMKKDEDLSSEMMNASIDYPGAAKVDIQFEFVEYKNALFFGLIYNTDLFEEATIHEMLQQLNTHLNDFYLFKSKTVLEYVENQGSSAQKHLFNFNI